MKTCLINPNWRWLKDKFRGSISPTQPLDLAYCAASIREQCETSILDMNVLNLGLDDIPEADTYILTTAPGYVFWRCAPLSEDVPLRIIRFLRKMSADCRIIVIGPHATLFPGHFLGNDLGDVVVRGEPELIIREVVSRITDIRSLSGITGVCFLSGGKIIEDDGLNEVDNLDELPYPAYDMLPMGKYPPHNSPDEGNLVSTLYEASRGCVYNCSYCFKKLFRNRFRKKSPEKIRDELARLRDEHNIEYVYFIDENFGAEESWLYDVCELVGDLELSWGCQTSFDVMSEESLLKMAEAGCVEAEFGLESADPEILKRLQKHIDLEEAEKLIGHAVDVGIRPMMFMLVGSPGETDESIERSVDFLKKFSDCRIWFSVDIPLPYPTTTLWKIGRGEGKIREGGWDELSRVAGTIGNEFAQEDIIAKRDEFFEAIHGRLGTINKILMVEPFGRGGISHYSFNLCNALGKDRHVTLLTSDDFELDGFEKDFTARKIFKHSRMPLRSFLRILTICRRHRYDIVHLQWLPSVEYPWQLEFKLLRYRLRIRSEWIRLRQDVFLVKLLRHLGLMVVYTAHNLMPHEEKEGYSGLMKSIYSSVDAIIVHSKNDREELIKEFKIPPENIHVIPHGDYTFFNRKKTPRGEARKQLGLKDSDVVVLFFGAIREYKGLNVLLKSFKIVREKVENAKLVVAGNPFEDEEKYLRISKELGIEKDTIFRLQYIPFDEVGNYFEAADIVAQPYLKTYQSGVVQIAYGFGKPVVTTDTGGLPEAVEDGKSGYIVRPGDEKALAEKLVELLKDKQKRGEMGAYAKELAETRFSWRQVAAQTIDVYRKVSRK